MNAQKDLAEKVGLAEASVQAVKDPELRRVAFEKVLESLLRSDPQPDAKPSTLPARSKKKPKASDSTAKKKSRGGPKAYISELIEDGFFAKPKSITEVQKDLANRGHHVVLTSLSGPLQRLCQDRQLRRQQQSVNGNGSKKVFLYSKW